MSKNRFCPVCGTRILSLNTTHCIKCNFDLENVNNVEAIERAKKLVNEKPIKKNSEPNKIGPLILKYIGAFVGIGIIIFIVVVIFAENGIFMAGHEWTMLFYAFIFPCFLGLGLIAGLIFGILNLVSRFRKK